MGVGGGRVWNSREEGGPSLEALSAPLSQLSVVAVTSDIFGTVTMMCCGIQRRGFIIFFRGSCLSVMYSMCIC